MQRLTDMTCAGSRGTTVSDIMNDRYVPGFFK
jgi:hypothetical protein